MIRSVMLGETSSPADPLLIYRESGDMNKGIQARSLGKRVRAFVNVLFTSRSLSVYQISNILVETVRAF